MVEADREPEIFHTKFSRIHDADGIGNAIGLFFRALRHGFLASIIFVIGAATAFADTTSEPASLTLFRSCQIDDEMTVRDAIARETASRLHVAYDELDFAALARQEWEANRLRSRYHALVDSTVEAVQGDTSWWRRYLANYNTGSAEQFARDISDKVYKSSEFETISKTLVDVLARQVIENAAVRSANEQVAAAAIECLTTFVGARYGASLGRFFRSYLSEVELRAPDNGPEASSGTVDTAVIIAGVLLVVMRRVTASIVRSVAAKVVGRVATLAAGSIALALGPVVLAWEIWSAPSGPFPIIASQLKSEEIEHELLSSFGLEFQTALAGSVAGVARDVADRAPRKTS